MLLVLALLAALYGPQADERLRGCRDTCEVLDDSLEAVEGCLCVCRTPLGDLYRTPLAGCKD